MAHSFADPFATVDDAALLGHSVTLPNLVKASIRIRAYLRSVGYPDPDPVSDELVELTCAIAARLGNVPDAVAQGVQQTQQSAGPFQQGATYGWDAWKAQADLTAGERAVLKRMFPPIPRTIVMGSPAGPVQGQP